MTTQLKVDFFRIDMPANTGTFQQLIQRIITSMTGPSRNASIRGMPIRLCRAEEEEDYWIGEMWRIRMTDLPVKANLAGQLRLIQFAIDEGCAEETAFLYHPASRVFLLQKRQQGVSASAFARYFEDMGQLAEAISIVPILEEDAMTRLRSMQTVRKLEVRVAPSGALSPQSQRHSLSGMIDILQDSEAPHVAVTLSMGHQPGSLSVSKVLRIATELVEGTGQLKAERIVITGKTAEEEESEVLDLLQFRMHEICPVQSNSDRRLTSAIRQAAIKTAWEKRRNEIERRYVQGGNR